MALLLWKIGYTAFVALVCAIWLRHYGARNFLWFSDIAFIGAVPAMWLASPALASVLAVAVLLPEILWNVDFVARLLLRRRITGLTDYMFEPERPRLLRGLSLFHVPLPLVLLWMVHAYGYDARSRAGWRDRPRGHRAALEPGREQPGTQHQLDVWAWASAHAPRAGGLHGTVVRRLRDPRVHSDPLPAPRHVPRGHVSAPAAFRSTVLRGPRQAGL